ncbi:MAG: glycosyltransferase family 2 protein [Silicimonas sp.]|nr:glycosyltransferase family 2 protein [Silicimonas sp.]
MTVEARSIRSFSVGDVAFLGAVRLSDRIVAVLAAGAGAADARARLGPDLIESDTPRQALALPVRTNADLPADPAEVDLFADRSVLVAFRSGETPAAAADWLKFHAETQGAEAALVFDRAPPGEAGFAAALDALNPALPVVVVTADRPTGQADGADTRSPGTAPASPKRSTAPFNPWFAPLREHGIYEILRHRFLAAAKSVAFANISDLILAPPSGPTVFELAAAHPGRCIPLQGIETYPWRLRKGAAAPHSDHVASRRSERRRVLSWAVSPEAMPPEALWRPGQPFGIEKAHDTLVHFVRAMGVVYPGAPVSQLVRKADLRESEPVLAAMTRGFGAEPIRLPSPAAIPARPKTGRTTIVTAMKNEGAFVLDWIAHNRVIGVASILAYSNDCEDGTDRLLSLLGDAGVTHRENPYRQTGKVPQHAAFRAAEAESDVTGADWLLTLDVDEYLNIHAGDGGIAALLSAVPDAHAISIPWRMFGNSGIHRFEDRPVAGQFTLAAPEFAPRPQQAWAYKTLYRNAGLFRRLGVHRPKGLNAGFRETLNWVDATGTALPPVIWDRAWRANKAQWGYTHAAVNHYSVRSAESFLVKSERGKVNRTGRKQGLAYWFRMNHNAVEDRSILRLADRVAAEKASLLALPGVRDAHEEAVAWHRARIAHLAAQPEFSELYRQITSPRMEHLSRMATCFGEHVHIAGPQVIPDEIAARDPSVPFFWTVNLKKAGA